MNRFVAVSILAVLLFGCSHGATSTLPSQGVHNQIIQGGPPPSNWEVFPLPDQSFSGDLMTIGPDHEIWMVGSGSVYRFDIATAKITTFSGLNTQGSITTGDGDLWLCGTYAVTKLTVTGQASVYPTSDFDCGAPVVGSDGALWYLGDHLMIGRVTADGVASHMAEPPNEEAWDLTSGPDGNIWFTENRFEREPGYHAIAKIDITTHAITEFKKTLRSFGGDFDRLLVDQDGNFYTDAQDQGGDIWRLTPTTGTWKKFALGLGRPLKPGDLSGLYFGGSSGGVKWTFAGHKTVAYGLPPDPSGFPAYSALTGPDDNVWFTNGPTLSIFINRVLSVSPASAMIGVGGMQTFTISESSCGHCIWTAKSSDTTIAMVSPVSNGQFTVTGVATGTATVVVSDKAQNAFDVQITVQ